KMEKWITAKGEWITRTGWHLLSYLAGQQNEVPDALFENYLTLIEKDIHQGQNRTKQAMNGALISIGARNENLKKRAVAAARRIGTVEIDHGDTDCKTPDAVTY